MDDVTSASLSHVPQAVGMICRVTVVSRGQRWSILIASHSFVVSVEAAMLLPTPVCQSDNTKVDGSKQ